MSLVTEALVRSTPCTGCKHLYTPHGGRAWCQEPQIISFTQATDPTTGRSYSFDSFAYRYGLKRWENTAERCRAEDMPCGPERKLWEPNFWRRLFGRTTPPIRKLHATG